MSEPSAKYIRRAAMGLLARREFALAELRLRLAAKFDLPELITTELEQLALEGLQSDTRFAEAFTRHHARKFHGPLRILRELEQRGVDRDTADAAVDPTSSTWNELARDWCNRGVRRDAARDASGRAKITRALLQRGFNHAQIRIALNDQ